MCVRSLVCDDARTNEPSNSDERRNVCECKFRASIIVEHPFGLHVIERNLASIARTHRNNRVREYTRRSSRDTRTEMRNGLD